VKSHHAPVVMVPVGGEDAPVCPHCGQVISPQDVYRDKRGWTFHRPCFRAGKGSVLLEEPRPSGLPSLEKEASNPSLARPRALNALDDTDRVRRNLLTLGSAQPPGTLPSAPSFLTPGVVLPAAGAAGGALLSGGDEDEEAERRIPARLRGALRGIATGGGAALGQHLAGEATGGDLGSRAGGGLAGGALALLLSRAIPK